MIKAKSMPFLQVKEGSIKKRHKFKQVAVIAQGLGNCEFRLITKEVVAWPV
jgi:hypothetical protein